jgi:hypothetical protein
MREPAPWQWWAFLAAGLSIVILWPPQGDKSLALKFVNWAVDPGGQLPVLPAQLPLGKGDDYEAVTAHDAIVHHYDTLYAKGGWTRTRLELKVVGDPVRPSTMRQMLLVASVILALLAWRVAARRE